ncbi:MAG: aminopeptidase P family N-terminal domain-containing protein, partial [Dehalococcoidia bacterium]
MVRRGREVIANVDRLQDHMDHNGLSAVVVRSGKNFTYLSGVSFPGTLARHLDLADSPRDVFVVWPRNGEPVIITNALGKPVVERDSWV